MGSNVRIDWMDFDAIPDRCERKLQAGLGKVAHAVQGLTVQLLYQQGAVDTGNLAGSYHVVEGVLQFWIVTGVDYSVYVEYGTYKMPARPHLTAARMAKTPMLRKVVAQALKEAVR